MLEQCQVAVGFAPDAFPAHRARAFTPAHPAAGGGHASGCAEAALRAAHERHALLVVSHAEEVGRVALPL